MKGKTVLALLLILAFATLPAYEKAGVKIKEEIKKGEQTLKLNGVALRKKMIFKVYVAALYLAETSADAAQIIRSDKPRLMQMTYLRSVEKAKLTDAWKEGIKENYAPVSRELQAKIDLFIKANSDVKDQDRWEIYYAPVDGTTFSINGKEVLRTDGKELFDALLSCWLGPEPGPGTGFKQDILKGIK
jgi:hypothetical protein